MQNNEWNNNKKMEICLEQLTPPQSPKSSKKDTSNNTNSIIQIQNNEWNNNDKMEICLEQPTPPQSPKLSKKENTQINKWDNKQLTPPQSPKLSKKENSISNDIKMEIYLEQLTPPQSPKPSEKENTSSIAQVQNNESDNNDDKMDQLTQDDQESCIHCKKWEETRQGECEICFQKRTIRVSFNIKQCPECNKRINGMNKMVNQHLCNSCHMKYQRRFDNNNNKVKCNLCNEPGNRSYMCNEYQKWYCDLSCMYGKKILDELKNVAWPSQSILNERVSILLNRYTKTTRNAGSLYNIEPEDILEKIRGKLAKMVVDSQTILQIIDQEYIRRLLQNYNEKYFQLDEDDDELYLEQVVRRIKQWTHNEIQDAIDYFNITKNPERNASKITVKELIEGKTGYYYFNEITVFHYNLENIMQHYILETIYRNDNEYLRIERQIRDQINERELQEPVTHIEIIDCYEKLKKQNVSLCKNCMIPIETGKTFCKEHTKDEIFISLEELINRGNQINCEAQKDDYIKSLEQDMKYKDEIIERLSTQLSNEKQNNNKLSNKAQMLEEKLEETNELITII